MGKCQNTYRRLGNCNDGNFIICLDDTERTAATDNNYQYGGLSQKFVQFASD